MVVVVEGGVFVDMVVVVLEVVVVDVVVVVVCRPTHCRRCSSLIRSLRVVNNYLVTKIKGVKKTCILIVVNVVLGGEGNDLQHVVA